MIYLKMLQQDTLDAVRKSIYSISDCIFQVMKKTWPILWVRKKELDGEVVIDNVDR